MRRHAFSLLILLVALTVGLANLPADGARADEGASAASELDVLFVGAHPDDEAFGLATYGQWDEYAGLRTGVITITRGEGGGNAVGLEEGAELGLLREGEERRAVGRVGIRNIYNFDYVDFWYNLSAPLTEEIWERDDPDDVLERAVRVLRMTRPEVIVTMNPGVNHGHHQYAAWLAMEAFYAAADPDAFPDQIRDEGLRPHRAAKIFTNRFQGQGSSGPSCVSQFTKLESTDTVYGVWTGTHSERHDKTWAAVARDAQREYASQGWSGFPDVPTDPNLLGCNYFTLIDSRVPFTIDSTEPNALLEGAHIPAAGGLALGSELFISTDRFRVPAGQSVEVTVHARNGGRTALRNASTSVEVPTGWTVDGDGTLGTLPPGRERTATFTLTPAAGTEPGRFRLAATLAADGATGTTVRALQVVSDVTGTVELHPDVARFREFVREIGVEQVDSQIKPRLAIGVGETRSLRVDLTNYTDAPQDGTVALDLPDGFSADAVSKPYTGLAPGADGAVTFAVTNTGTDLPTANSAPNGGDYDLAVTTTSTTGDAFQETGALNLVPVTTIPGATTAPVLDGTASPGEYTGEPIDLSRRWEGQEPDSPQDASGSARLAWHDDALYLHIDVVDDTLGAVLTPEDAKRHWRTDSVEITIDPRGDSRDPSTTFKVGVFPVTDDPGAGDPPAAYRDADNHQGPIAETAPGMEVSSTVGEPYAGYTLEVKIPLAELPAAVDPDRMGLNVFIYDSDTQDKTGQSRLGWSTFGGVQAAPWRWGHATLDGYTPPPDRPTEPAEPIIPLEVARSVDSPQSILQSTQDGVPLASGEPARRGARVRVVDGPELSGSTLTATLRSNEPGTANVFAWGDEATVAQEEVALRPGRAVDVSWRLDEEDRAALEDGGVLLIGFEADRGGTLAVAAPID
ncbi:sugar-binding protein [soil metagenome]